MAATPSKLLPTVPVPSLRLLTTLQLVPFHCSVRVSKLEKDVLKVFPTLQLEPFQCRVSVCKTLLLELSAYPTAQMSVAETTATEFNWFLNVPTLGLENTLQLVPFQCSINVCRLSVPPLDVWEYPTAQT